MILFSILALIIFFSLKQKNKWVSDLHQKVTSYPYIYWTLLGLLVFGFFTKLEYTNRLGCIVGSESIFSNKNILFSSISLLLIFSSLAFKHKFLKLSFILIELLLWIFKLFYYKGGYAVGFGGIADPVVSFYDTTTLFLRFLIIIWLLKLELKTMYVIAVTFVIISFKIFVFPIPQIVYVEERESLERAELTKEKLNGYWTGICLHDSIGENKMIHFIDTINASFKKNEVVLYGFKGIDSMQFEIDFNSELSGSIHRKEPNPEEYYSSFYISRISNDSLDMSFSMNSFGHYGFQLTKKE